MDRRQANRSDASSASGRRKLSPLRKCYWLTDAAKVGIVGVRSGDTTAAEPAWLSAVVVEEPSEAEYYEAIEGGLATDPLEEKQLRILAFQRGNDAFRKHSYEEPGAAPTAVPPEARRGNLEVVARMLDEANDEELIMKAEVLRELGQFSSALNCLDRIKSSNYDWVVRQMRPLCERQEAHSLGD